jgi:hypothetical protein
MKERILLIISMILFLTDISYPQTFPKIEESVRLKRLEPPKGKVRIVLDTDTYNEIDDQFALSYAYLSKKKFSLRQYMLLHSSIIDPQAPVKEWKRATRRY